VQLLEQLSVASLSGPTVFFAVVIIVTVILWANNDDDKNSQLVG